MQSEKTLIQKIIDKNIKFKNSGNRFHELDLGEEAPCGGRSSFYDGPKFVDERMIQFLPMSDPKRQKYEKDREHQRISKVLNESYAEDF